MSDRDTSILNLILRVEAEREELEKDKRQMVERKGRQVETKYIAPDEQ